MHTQNQVIRLDQHHELSENRESNLYRDDEKNTGGSLGKKTGVKYRSVHAS